MAKDQEAGLRARRVEDTLLDQDVPPNAHKVDDIDVNVVKEGAFSGVRALGIVGE